MASRHLFKPGLQGQQCSLQAPTPCPATCQPPPVSGCRTEVERQTDAAAPAAPRGSCSASTRQRKISSPQDYTRNRGAGETRSVSSRVVPTIFTGSRNPGPVGGRHQPPPSLLFRTRCSARNSSPSLVKLQAKRLRSARKRGTRLLEMQSGTTLRNAAGDRVACVLSCGALTVSFARLRTHGCTALRWRGSQFA